MKPSAIIKPVNYFSKILHLTCLTGFWMRLLFSVHIWEFECPHSRLFQRLGVLNSFQPTILLILKANQIDWLLHERNWYLECVKKCAKCLRNTWWNFCLLVKLLKYLTISANITCSKSTIKALEEGVKMCSKLIIKTPEQRQWRLSGVINVKLNILEHIELFLKENASATKCSWTGRCVTALIVFHYFTSVVTATCKQQRC